MKYEYRSILVCQHFPWEGGAHGGFIPVHGVYDTEAEAWNAGVRYARSRWLRPRERRFRPPGTVGGEHNHEISVVRREVLGWEVVVDFRPDFVGRRFRLRDR